MGLAVGPLVRGRSRTRLEVVVAVAGLGRRPALQEVLEVPEKERLVLVDHHGGRGVPALDRDHPLVHARPPHPLRHQLRQVDELKAPLRPKPYEVPADPDGGPPLHADEQARSHNALLRRRRRSGRKVGERSEEDLTGR